VADRSGCRWEGAGHHEGNLVPLDVKVGDRVLSGDSPGRRRLKGDELAGEDDRRGGGQPDAKDDGSTKTPDWMVHGLNILATR
jgi:hypothetical protein